jgi:hypothetical protein
MAMISGTRLILIRELILLYTTKPIVTFSSIVAMLKIAVWITLLVEIRRYREGRESGKTLKTVNLVEIRSPGALLTPQSEYG